MSITLLGNLQNTYKQQVVVRPIAIEVPSSHFGHYSAVTTPLVDDTTTATTILITVFVLLQCLSSCQAYAYSVQRCSLRYQLSVYVKAEGTYARSPAGVLVNKSGKYSSIWTGLSQVTSIK